jgi:hypothetical protein
VKSLSSTVLFVPWSRLIASSDEGEEPLRDGEKPLRDGEEPLRDGEEPLRDPYRGQEKHY